MIPLGRLLPRETGRGRAARRLAAGLGLIPDETRTRDLARYARQVEPGLFAPPLTVAPDPDEPWFSLVIPCFNTADR
jgi:hypothetical protein